MSKKIEREHLRTTKTLDRLVYAGLTRDSRLTKGQFLKKIGKNGAKDPELEERKAILSLQKECLREVNEITTILGLLTTNVQATKGGNNNG